MSRRVVLSVGSAGGEWARSILRGEHTRCVHPGADVLNSPSLSFQFLRNLFVCIGHAFQLERAKVEHAQSSCVISLSSKGITTFVTRLLRLVETVSRPQTAVRISMDCSLNEKFVLIQCFQGQAATHPKPKPIARSVFQCFRFHTRQLVDFTNLRQISLTIAHRSVWQMWMKSETYWQILTKTGSKRRPRQQFARTCPTAEFCAA